MRVIQNGVLVPIEESDCNDKGWMIGNGVFETIKTVENKPWALSRHMRRAVASAQQLGLRIPAEDLVRNSVENLLETQQHRHNHRHQLHMRLGAKGRRRLVRNR